MCAQPLLGLRGRGEPLDEVQRVGAGRPNQVLPRTGDEVERLQLRGVGLLVGLGPRVGGVLLDRLGAGALEARADVVGHQQRCEVGCGDARRRRGRRGRRGRVPPHAATTIASTRTTRERTGGKGIAVNVSRRSRAASYKHDRLLSAPDRAATDPVASARGLAALLLSIHRDARREARSLPREEEYAAAARAFWRHHAGVRRRRGRARRARAGGAARAGPRGAEPVVAAQPLLEPRLPQAARVRRGFPDARVDLRPRARRLRGPDPARRGQRPRSPVRRPAQRALRLEPPRVVRAAGARARRAVVAAGPRPRHRLRREPLPARRDR